MTLERGTLLHKRYRIVEILGRGGMGSVIVQWMKLGVDVAVKENLFHHRRVRASISSGSRILANLRHPNLPA